MDALTNAHQTAWPTHMGILAGANVRLETVKGVDLSNQTPVSSEPTFTAMVGQKLDPLEPSSLCVNVRCKVNARYRGGHPRLFLPLGSTADVGNEYQWSAGFASQVSAGVQSYVNTIKTGAIAGGVVTPVHTIPTWVYSVTNDSVHQKYVRKRESFKIALDVSAYVAQEQFGSQRRRLKI
jgi:hypothetical protein